MEQNIFENYLKVNKIKPISLKKFQSPLGIEVTLENLLHSDSFNGFNDGFSGKSMQISSDPENLFVILPKTGKIKYNLEAKEMILRRFEYIREYALGMSLRN